MPLIQIDRNSIKKNPRAGQTFTAIENNPPRIKFEIDTDLPEFIKEGEDVIVKSSSTIVGQEGMQRGNIKGEFISKDESLLRRFFITPGCRMSVERDTQTIQHDPEPDYLYKYENPLLTCANCGSEVRVEDIEREYDEDLYDVCPICQAVDTFGEIKYEHIEDVIKEQ